MEIHYCFRVGCTISYAEYEEDEECEESEEDAEEVDDDNEGFISACA